MRVCFSRHLDQRNEQGLFVSTFELDQKSEKGLFFSTFGLDQRHEERVFCSPASMRPVMELVPIGRRHFDLKSVQMGSCCKETEVGLKCGHRTWFADQNQPLISLGKNSGLSQPSKLHLWGNRFNLFQSIIYCLKNLRPEVQKNFTPPSMKPLTQSYSCWVSKDTRSMQRFLEEVRYQDAIWTGLQESEAELIFYELILSTNLQQFRALNQSHLVFLTFKRDYVNFNLNL